MTRALIGSTGFVGGNLQRQTSFDELFHSKNVESLRGRSYDVLVCAAAPAEKWRANLEPERDLENLERLMDCLAGARAGHVVLISTVDVYPAPVEVDEATPIDPEGGHAYGRHRLLLEGFVRERFDATVVRLPGLFGPGLKKNVIYDFLHDNEVQKIGAGGVFQFYDLSTLWQDVQRVREAGVPLMNFATEPVSVRELAREAFGLEFENPAVEWTARYDFRTRHAGLFGRSDGYMYGRRQVLDAMRTFVESEGWQRP